MPRINQKGFAHILLFLILLAGLVAGIYLVQKQQIFKPKAAEMNPSTPGFATSEYDNAPPWLQLLTRLKRIG